MRAREAWSTPRPMADDDARTCGVTTPGRPLDACPHPPETVDRMKRRIVVALAVLLAGQWLAAQDADNPAQPAAGGSGVAAGKAAFQQTCGFCHGPDGRGASGPDLIRSTLVSHTSWTAGNMLPSARAGRSTRSACRICRLRMRAEGRRKRIEGGHASMHPCYSAAWIANDRVPNRTAPGGPQD
jgi:mono/diheme cytochrome c family protein